MVGRTYSKLAIGQFEFTKNVSSSTFNSIHNSISLEYNCHLGISTLLLHASPFNFVENINVHYNGNSITFRNSNYISPIDIYYTHQPIDIQSNIGDGESSLSLEHTIYSVKYNSLYKPVKNIQLDAIQFKVDNTSSLCITYDIIPNWSLYTPDPHKHIIGVRVSNSMYYDNFSSINTDKKVCMYYMQIIPFSDIYIDDGSMHFKHVRIRDCLVYTSDAPSGYVLAHQNNKYLIAVINA